MKHDMACGAVSVVCHTWGFSGPCLGREKWRLGWHGRRLSVEMGTEYSLILSLFLRTLPGLELCFIARVRGQGRGYSFFVMVRGYVAVTNLPSPCRFPLYQSIPWVL